MSNCWHANMINDMTCWWDCSKISREKKLLDHYQMLNKININTYRRQESTPSMEEPIWWHIVPSKERASPSACSSVSHWVNIWFKIQLLRVAFNIWYCGYTYLWWSKIHITFWGCTLCRTCMKQNLAKRMSMPTPLLNSRRVSTFFTEIPSSLKPSKTWTFNYHPTFSWIRNN